MSKLHATISYGKDEKFLILKTQANTHTLGRSRVVQAILDHGKYITSHSNERVLVQLTQAFNCCRPLFWSDTDAVHTILKAYIIKVQFV